MEQSYIQDRNYRIAKIALFLTPILMVLLMGLAVRVGKDTLELLWIEPLLLVLYFIGFFFGNLFAAKDGNSVK